MKKWRKKWIKRLRQNLKCLWIVRCLSINPANFRERGCQLNGYDEWRATEDYHAWVVDKENPISIADDLRATVGVYRNNRIRRVWLVPVVMTLPPGFMRVFRSRYVLQWKETEQYPHW